MAELNGSTSFTINSSLKEQLRLTAEDVKITRFQAYCSEGYPLSLTEDTLRELINKIAEAQLAKVLSDPRILVKEELDNTIKEV